jgi:NADH-quinone oxidoreductase subunit J
VFATVLVCAALGVISRAIRCIAALSLVLCFVTSAAIWLLLEAEFLAIVLVLVYVGAVMVLFLFVVMMLDINLEELRAGLHALRLAGVDRWPGRRVRDRSGVVVTGSSASMSRAAAPLPANYSNTQALGTAALHAYAYPFEIAAMVLLVAIVAAIALTLRHRTGSSRRTSPSRSPRAPRSACESSRWPRRSAHDHAGARADAVGILFAMSVAGMFLNRKNVICC